MSTRICVVTAYFFMVLINVNGFTRELFKFGYDEGDLLKMGISFKLPPEVTAGYVVVRYISTEPYPIRIFEIRRPDDETDDPVATVEDFIFSKHVYIDVQLYNDTDMILNKKISEGAAVKSAMNSNLDSTYSLSCLNGETCGVETDLRMQTDDADIRETKTSNDNHYIIIIICLSVFSIAMLVLAIVSFTKSCWFKRYTPKILQEPLQKCIPFYENLIFRRECQEIIDDLEQNHYELIDPFERR